MADEEFRDPERLRLIQELQRHVRLDSLLSEMWAMLWLSDINRLRDMVNKAQDPNDFTTWSSLKNGFAGERVSKTCKFSNLLRKYY